MGEATRNLPLSYRPDEYDDWGVIRFAPDGEGRRWHALKVSLPTHDENILSQHRVNGTDPCEEFGRRIVTAVNCHAALIKYLAIFLGHDERFQVAVGGNPNAVDAMLEEGRAFLAKVQES